MMVGHGPHGLAPPSIQSISRVCCPTDLPEVLVERLLEVELGVVGEEGGGARQVLLADHLQRALVITKPAVSPQ
jgi:hypothetical protein